jgi:hypothetical protein
VFDENVFPFASLHPNAGALLKQQILLLPEGTQNIDNHVPVIVPITDVQQVAEAAETNAGENVPSNSPEFSFEFHAEEDETGADSHADFVRHSPGRQDPQADPSGCTDPEADSRGPSPHTWSSSPSSEAGAHGDRASPPLSPGSARGSAPRGAATDNDNSGSREADSSSSSLSPAHAASGSSVAGSGGEKMLLKKNWLKKITMIMMVILLVTQAQAYLIHRYRMLRYRMLAFVHVFRKVYVIQRKY